MLLALILSAAPSLADEPAGVASDTSAEAAGAFPFEVTPFGRLYFRPELGLNRHDYDWGNGDTDFTFTLRTNTGLDVALDNDIHLVVDLQSYGTYNLNAAPLEPGIKLYQGYLDFVDMGGSPLDLRVGRAELERYGDGMLIAPDRFYDGFSLEQARLRYDTDKVVLNAAWHQLYAPGTSPTGEETWRNPVLFGTHDTFLINPAFNVDAYWWWLVSKPFMGFATQTYSLGGRVFGATGEAGDSLTLDYSAEGVWQTGTAKLLTDKSVTATINAYAVNPKVGLGTGPLHFGLEYYRASGDDDLTDGVIRSFNLMWQDPHGRFGNLDRYLGSNIQAGIVSAEVALGGEMAGHLGLNGTTLSVLEAGDPNAGVFEDGSIPRARAPKAIGMGGDLWWRQPVSRQVMWDMNLSVLQPGGLIQDTLGSSDLVLRAYGTIEANF